MGKLIQEGFTSTREAGDSKLLILLLVRLTEKTIVSIWHEVLGMENMRNSGFVF